MRKSQLSHRITWRVIGIILFFNMLTMGAIQVFVLVVSLMNSTMRGQYVVNGIEGEMESMLNGVHIAAVNSRAEIERNMESPEQVFDALEREFQVNENFIGCFAAFEPDYFKGQGRWFEAYLYHTDSTHHAGRQIGSPNHDYFHGPWYEKGISLDRKDMGYLTSPYFDNSVDSSMYCSYVLPIVDRQGRKVGVYGVDVKYLWIESVIAEVEKNISREFFNQKLQADDGTLYFSVQIIDNNGNRVVGSNALDINILKAEQKDIFGNLAMKNLKGTPYYINSKKLANTEWTVSVLQHRRTVFAWGKVLSIVIFFFMVLGLFVIFLFTRGSIRRATKPLGILSESAKEVAKGNFDAPLPTFKHDDEVAQLRDSFGAMQQSLKQFIEELKVSTAAKAALESELNIARDIQLSMVPTEFPRRSDFDIYASMTPAKAVGGDLYDFFVRDNELVFCLGDVCGKGVPAALFMTETRSLFRAFAAEESTPDLIASKMNKVLSQNNENMMFVTIFIGILDLTTGVLSYCNAGHKPPLIIDKELKRLPLEGIAPIGLFADTPFVMHTLRLEPQSTLLVYTDGLNEAATVDNETFGDNRVFNEVICAIQAGQVTPKELIERQTQAVHDFVGEAEQSDDLTMLAIKYRY